MITRITTLSLRIAVGLAELKEALPNITIGR
jgi:hypothetical protein